jgi:putative NADPH-quinone reductase
MDKRRILVIQGHPDAGGGHLGHALAGQYVEGAQTAGHEVRTVDVATLDFPLLRSKRDWEGGSLPPALHAAQQDIAWANHLVLLFPLWLGDMPALLKGFLEQVARPGFAVAGARDGGMAKKLLGGRSARVVVTMGMPAIVYRWYFQAHSVKSLERNILGFVGIAPIHRTLIGMVEDMSDEGRARWMSVLRAFGDQAA